MSVISPITMQLKRAASTVWTSLNPTLLNGEEGYETDTGRRKVGNGTSAWNQLGYDDAPLPRLQADNLYSGNNRFRKAVEIEAAAADGAHLRLGAATGVPLSDAHPGLQLDVADGVTARVFLMSDDEGTVLSHLDYRPTTDSYEIGSPVFDAAGVTTLATSGAVVLTAGRDKFLLTPTGNVTLTAPTPVTGHPIRVLIGPSAFGVTWSITGLKWPGGVAPTLPTVAGRFLIVTLTRWGTNDWTGEYATQVY